MENFSEKNFESSQNKEELINSAKNQIDLLVRKFVDKLPGSVTPDDLKSWAYLGAVEAANKFDPSRGVLFKTYAEHKIKSAIMDNLRKLDPVKREVRKNLKRIERAERKAGQSGMQNPTEEAIALAMEINLDDYRKIIANLSHSKTITLSDTETMREANKIQARHTPVEEELALAKALKNVYLTPQQRTIIDLTFYQNLSPREVATKLGVNISRVFQLRKEALEKLRNYLTDKRSGNAHP